MIRLHHLSRERDAFFLNPDLIERIEAAPDTILTLTTGGKVHVDEPVDVVVAKVRDWRTEIAVNALRLAKEG
ncbi:MAG TPA: flagellar FlbD family protein [Capillimicrobium sp.]|nr:flagellar FlbD family protein [Capillimicrobium sp.]